MSRITISSPKPLIFGGVMLRYATNTARAERLELRIAELDLAHAVELKYPDTPLQRAKQRLTPAGRRRD